jgi:alpha-1,2-mannosyltransferase
MSGARSFQRLVAWEKWGIATLLVAAFGFSGVVVQRSAFFQRRRTDAGVYFRAAWAVRAGADPYAVKDENGWTYLYPPPLAIVMAPLADPPPSLATPAPAPSLAPGISDSGADREWMLPYAVSVALWYVISIVALVVAAQWLALAVEASSDDEQVRTIRTGCRRWWQDRILPALFCGTAVGSTLSRGQVNILLVMLLSGMILAVVRSRPWKAGGWLAGAAALKVFPAFLLIYPLWRRDARFLAGFAVGMAGLLVALPVLTVGPSRAMELDRRFVESMLLPHMGLGGADEGGAGEGSAKPQKVVELQKTMDNQSVMAVINATVNLREVREGGVANPRPWMRAVHWSIGAALVLTTLWAAGWRGAPIPMERMLALCLLACAMLAITPVCHLHYFVLAMPLMAALLGLGYDRSTDGELRWWVWVLLGVYFAMNTIPRFDAFDATRHLGLAMYANLGLWAAGVVVLRRTVQARLTSTCPPAPDTSLIA